MPRMSRSIQAVPSVDDHLIYTAAMPVRQLVRIASNDIMTGFNRRISRTYPAGTNHRLPTISNR